MPASVLAPTTPTRETARAGWLRRMTFGDLLSLRYLLLRSWTAGSALLAGLIQTYVFARALEPGRFSIFILVGALGVSMWLFDLGLSKILFVRMRKHFLDGEKADDIAAQTSAVALFYAAIVAAASIGCFVMMTMRPSVSSWQAAEFALFMFFTAINLSWFVLRNVSVATDQYITFETLDALRRLGFIALLLALLIGLPFSVFVIAINLCWVAVFAVMIPRLVRLGALAPRLRGSWSSLRRFFRDNRQSAFRTGTHAAGELYIHNVLYLVVPLAFGLGAPTIIVDTALKIFLGLLTLCSAACDLLVPRQTSAYAANDARTLTRATLMAAGLCALPAIAIAGLLLIDSEGLFAFLLGQSAVMPPQVTPILLVLLAAAVAKAAPNFLLQHTGYFREVARLSAINMAAMTLVMAGSVLAGLSIVQLLMVYAAVIAASSGLFIVFALRGPIRHARMAASTVARA